MPRRAVAVIDGGRLAGHDIRTGRTVEPDDLVTELDRAGITTALVGSWRCLHQDVRRGNLEAVAWAEREPGRLRPLAIVQPSYYGRTADDLVGEAVDAGAVSVAVYGEPWMAAGEWASPAVRAVGEAAATAGVPLQAVIASGAEIGPMAATWGDLPVPILLRRPGGHRYRWVAAELAAMARCPNIHLDVGSACSIGLVELLVERVGADRLFFATNEPITIGGASIAVVRAASLAAGDASAIGGGTLRSVFGLEADADLVGVAADEDDGIFDTHWHHDHWNLGEPQLDRADQIRALERFGIVAALTSSVLAITYDLCEGNQSTADWCATGPWRGYVVVDPRRPDASIAELDRWGADPRFVGAKTIQDTSATTLSDPGYGPILDRIAALGMPLLCHLPGLAEVAAARPGQSFVAAHANARRAVGLFELGNVSFDFSTSHADRDETQLAEFVRDVGAHRVLFGSDGPLVSPAWSLAKLRDAGLSAAERDLVLRRNAERLFPAR